MAKIKMLYLLNKQITKSMSLVRNFIYCKNEEQHMIIDFCASQTVH